MNLAAAVAKRVANKAAQPPACHDVTVLAAWAVGDCVCVVFRSRLVGDPMKVLGLVYDLDFHPPEAGPVTDIEAAAYHILAFEVIEPHPYPDVYTAGAESIRWRVMSARDHDLLAVISQLPDVDALVNGGTQLSLSNVDSGSYTGAEIQGGETDIARASSALPSNEGLWSLDRVEQVIPAALSGLAVTDCEASTIDSQTVLCARLGVPGDGAGWIRATRTDSAATLDEFENDEDIYREPMFVVSRLGDTDRQKFGEYAYVTHKHDATEVWTLHADTVTIQAGFPRGAVSEDDLLVMARQILHEI